MSPISGVNPGAAQPLTGVDKVLGAPKAQRPGEETAGRPLKPVMDEYVPEEKQEPSGRYWMDKDEDGQPKIIFDDPSKSEPPEQGPAAEGPEKKDEKVERCDTGKVDREIEKLKKKREELERRLSAETDEARIKDLERQLAQVERELKQKDNDAYRKQHTTFTFTQL